MKKEIKKEIDEADEITLYFVINTLGMGIWHVEHAMADGRIPVKEHPELDKGLIETRETQQYAISKLPKIGVEKPQQKDKTATPDYWAWFRWWDGYIKGLSKKEWQELDRKIAAKEDVTSYRPEGRWQDNIVAEKEDIKKAQKFFNR